MYLMQTGNAAVGRKVIRVFLRLQEQVRVQQFKAYMATDADTVCEAFRKVGEITARGDRLMRTFAADVNAAYE